MPEFDCSREIVVSARPERVWNAVATTEGNAGWLFPNEIDPAGAGATAWDPPTHFAVRQEQGDWFNELEFAIADRGDGTSEVRYAHCGVFPPEEFETQNEAIQQHTDFYLHTLGEYLEHFADRPATYIGDVPGGIAGPPASATPDGFARLQRALGLDEQAGEGDPVRLTPDGVEPIVGVIDYMQPNFMGIRTADALYCFFGRNSFGGPVGMSIHSFADGVDPEQTAAAWRQYLTTAF
jgi:uncharacterized protein YndB with AHSA1/START domain